LSGIWVGPPGYSIPGKPLMAAALPPSMWCRRLTKLNHRIMSHDKMVVVLPWFVFTIDNQNRNVCSW
jgi:hypothetical protein